MDAYNWQQKGWPDATCNRAALRDELRAFETAFREVRKSLKKPQDPEVVARALADEAVKTSAIEGVNVDESAVMSSICKALGGPETRYRLAMPPREPIEPLNEPLNKRLAKLVAAHPGVRIPYIKSVVGASTATIKRAVAALVKAGRIEHRGSKRTGGYYAISGAD